MCGSFATQSRMKHVAAVSLLLAASTIAVAQPAPPPLPPVDPQVIQLRDAALHDDYAWDITEGLTTEIGPRLDGSEREAAARRATRSWRGLILAERAGGGKCLVRLPVMPARHEDHRATAGIPIGQRARGPARSGPRSKSS